MASSSDDEGDEELEGEVHLGFLGPRTAQFHSQPNWSSWDGGLVGGWPSWLNPRDLPAPEGMCQKPSCQDSSVICL